MNLSHSKYRNSGLLFELLIRQISADILANKESPAINILKKYFNHTEVGKEYKLYQTISNSKQLSEGKAEVLINTILDLSLRLNKQSLRKEKYNLINEIKNHYNLDEFFKIKINNYKIYASLYNLMEAKNTKEFINPSSIVTNKHTLLEYVTKTNVDSNIVEDKVMEEYLNMDKGSRIMTYKMLLEKFNNKYSNLNIPQKLVLKEYINNLGNNVYLSEFVNNQFIETKKQLIKTSKKVDDKITKIKIDEVITLINPVAKKQNVKDEDLVNILYYYQLLEELNEAIGG